MQYQSLLKVIIYILEPPNNKGKYQKYFCQLPIGIVENHRFFLFLLSARALTPIKNV